MYANAIVEIVVPPEPVTRFRYAVCNRISRIQGYNSTEDIPTYLTLSVYTPGYAGQFFLVVSCVSTNRPFMPHPNSLLGEHCREGFYKYRFESNGVCPTIVQFRDLSIERSKFADVREKLEVREGRNIDPFRTGFSHKNENRREFKLLIDTKEVRLCFQVFLIGDEKVIPARPVVSSVIYNNQKPGRETMPAHPVQPNVISPRICHNQRWNQDQAVLNNHLQRRSDNPMSIPIRHNQLPNREQAVPNSHLRQRSDNPLSIPIRHNQQQNQEQPKPNNHLQQRNGNTMSIAIRDNQQPSQEQALLNNHLQQRNDNISFLLLFPDDDIPLNYINQLLKNSHSQKFDSNKSISDLSNEFRMISLEGKI